MQAEKDKSMSFFIFFLSCLFCSFDIKGGLVFCLSLEVFDVILCKSILNLHIHELSNYIITFKLRSIFNCLTNLIFFKQCCIQLTCVSAVLCYQFPFLTLLTQFQCCHLSIPNRYYFLLKVYKITCKWHQYLSLTNSKFRYSVIMQD